MYKYDFDYDISIIHNIILWGNITNPPCTLRFNHLSHQLGTYKLTIYIIISIVYLHVLMHVLLLRVQHCVIAATAALAYIIRYTMDRYRKNGQKIFDRRTSSDDYSKPDGWSTTTAATLVGANGIATTVGANNRETNNFIVLGDSNHGRSVMKEDPLSVAPVVVVDMENDDCQVETNTADTYGGLVVRPEAIKAS